MMLNMMSMCNHMMGGQPGQPGGGREASREVTGGAGPSGWDSYQSTPRQGYSSAAGAAPGGGGGGASGASRYSTGYSSGAGYDRYGSFGETGSDYSGSSSGGGYSGGYTSSGYTSDSYGASASAGGYTSSSGQGYSGTQGYSDYSSTSYNSAWSTGGQSLPRPGAGGGGPVRSAPRDPRANPYSRN